MDSSDLTRPIIYDERLVVFFDVLGWKSHVKDAGSDPVKIGQLALIPKLLKSSTILQAAGSGEARITSFSDCCVISIPYKKEELAQVIYGLSNVFVGAAISGFLLRAGVTIGDIHHQNDIVFGPALNTAHSLESNGKFPRIILDPSISELQDIKLIEGMHGNDGAGVFIDPYRLEFVRSDYLLKDSFPNSSFMGEPSNKAVEIYTLLLMRLESILSKTEGGKPGEQVNWLYARVRQQHKSILNG